MQCAVRHSKLGLPWSLRFHELFMQGVPPATLAEWTLSGGNGNDYYDGEEIYPLPSFNDANKATVSLVDGFNLPMQITNNVGCPVAGCDADLAAICE